jgi:exocyst complex component 4
VQLVFRFADADIKLTSKTLKKNEDELTRVLRDTMPGLVQTSSEQAVQTTIATVGIDDRMIGAGQRHHTLIRPHAFHVAVMFQPTLAFLSRVMDILPSGADAATASGNILDEFVLKVYLPQLEEKVLALFQHAITGA